MKISTLILAFCTLSFAACVGTPKKTDACCAQKTDKCCAGDKAKNCPEHPAAGVGKKKSS